MLYYVYIIKVSNINLDWGNDVSATSKAKMDLYIGSPIQIMMIKEQNI